VWLIEVINIGVSKEVLPPTFLPLVSHLNMPGFSYSSTFGRVFIHIDARLLSAVLVLSLQ